MKVITYQRKSKLSYPIGEGIQTNLLTIKNMAEALKGLNKSNILLCCQGSSGAIIAALVARELPENSCKIVHIKKPGEDSHTFRIGHLFDPESYVVIIDDFIISGRTVCQIYARIREHLHKAEIDCLCVDYCTKEVGKDRIEDLTFRTKLLILGKYGS